MVAKSIPDRLRGLYWRVPISNGVGLSIAAFDDLRIYSLAKTQRAQRQCRRWQMAAAKLAESTGEAVTRH